MKALLTKIGMILAGTAMVVGAPIIPQDTPLLYSIETTKLSLGEYTITPDGHIFADYMYTSATSSYSIERKETVPDNFDTAKLAYHPYESEYTAVFKSKDGSLVKKPMVKEDYVRLAGSGGAQYNPKNTELVSIIDSTQQASAAIAYDAKTDNGETQASSVTYAHTVTGTNPMLLVWGYNRGQNRSTTVTYNGVSMTKIGTEEANGLGAPYYDKIYAFYLLAPATGSNNVVVTYSAGDYQRSAAISYTGVAQSAALDQVNDIAVASSNTMTSNLTTGSDNEWVFVIAQWFNAGQTASTGSTLRQAGQGSVFEYSSNPATPAGATAMTTTSGTTENRYGKGFSFIPATAAAATPAVPIINNVWWD